MSLSFFVPGVPAPQGSKRYLRPGVMVAVLVAARRYEEGQT